MAVQDARRSAAQPTPDRRPFAGDVPRLRAADQHRPVLHRLQPEAGRQAVSRACRPREDLVGLSSGYIGRIRQAIWQTGAAIRANATTNIGQLNSVGNTVLVASMP